MNEDQQFLEFVIKAIVGTPDDVKVTRTVDERGVLLTLDLNPSDMGYVIGRRGQTARAIRTLLKIVGAKNNARVNLKINEPEGGRGPRMSHRDESHGDSHSDSRDEVDTSAVDNLNI
ncbi:MAG: RNA-binding protein [Candidatus Magasanikbacteria bacterium CG11_big_fil_rev_8_21_14_0_20_39_34]|uniref:RNA-binding protein KhpA n=1 Tax=Candidatus Magasanikbacteria bacterium CG11_big_fil_rev_8_21_14_0_20_39_34 TaxID=1974653 RepID=A0A2H0N631_9BACT|nr:MAG: RNA-binding protein [Candidatus Magasanikbacteria bacterium CG11_big_fil_rev_8_21_14_0_20_39_34]